MLPKMNKAGSVNMLHYYMMARLITETTLQCTYYTTDGLVRNIVRGTSRILN